MKNTEWQVTTCKSVQLYLGVKYESGLSCVVSMSSCLAFPEDEEMILRDLLSHSSSSRNEYPFVVTTGDSFFISYS